VAAAGGLEKLYCLNKNIYLNIIKFICNNRQAFLFQMLFGLAANASHKGDALHSSHQSFWFSHSLSGLV